MSTSNRKAVDLFDQYAQTYAEKYWDHSRYAASMNFLAKSLSNDATILDVACGPGNVINHLLQLKPTLKCTGFDLSKNMIKIAQNRIPKAHFREQDCQYLPASKSKFSGIISSFFFPYLSEKKVEIWMTNISNHLSKNGLLYISTMQGENKNSGLQTNRNGDKLFINYHELEFIRECLRANDFEILYEETIKNIDPEGIELPPDLILISKLN